MYNDPSFKIIWYLVIFSYFRKLLKRSRSKSATITKEHLIPRSKHCISKTDISINALKVLNRLNQAGYESYLVGGSVRDLLLRKVPKDFDITTNATPNQIKKLFRNARIIGRRFKIVHILFHREIIEVATFRAHPGLQNPKKSKTSGMLVQDNVFGTMEEDIWRRDFTINALLYDINQSNIIDITGGYQHLSTRTLHMIGDPETRYQEDPVRVLRALRFCAKLDFEMSPSTAQPIPNMIERIKQVSPSRLFDEITKLYQCGHAVKAHELTMKYGLFNLLFPLCLKPSTYQNLQTKLIQVALESTDRRIQENKPVNPAFILAIFLWFPLMERILKATEEGLQPLVALEKSMSELLASQVQTIAIPKRFTSVIREIWLLQYRFTKRFGQRPFQLLAHPRFRAAYDFLAIRALVGDADIELADWWTAFQDKDSIEQQKMIDAISSQSKPKRRKRKRPAAHQPSSHEK